MVERVEIVTGGASSTYGSDAVAGVVNFIRFLRAGNLAVQGEEEARSRLLWRLEIDAQ